MKRCIAVVVVSIVALSIPVVHAWDQTAMVKKTLERLAGRWTWTGQQANIGAENSPYGQAGHFVGSGEGRLIMDGQFILDEYQEKSPEGNVMHGVSLVSYDPVKERFVARDCMSDGSTSVAEFTIEGRVRKDHITITSKTGEILLARVAGEYSRDWKRLEATWEGSTDNGKTWQHWCSLVSEKTGETESEKQELIKLEHELAAAFEKRDLAVVGRINADDMTVGTSDGRFITKESILNWVKSDKYNWTSMVCEDLKVKSYGEMAVITGRLNIVNTKGNSWKDLITDVFLKRDGRWQMVATHSSKVTDKGDTDKNIPSPEMKKLEGLVGVWTYEGEQVDPPVDGLPYGPAGKYSGTTTNRFIMEGLFLESKTQDKNPSGTTSVLSITGYDAETKNYMANAFVSDGSRETSIESVSPDGRIWTSNSTITTSDGKKVLVKSVTKYSSDWSNSSGTTEVSPDDGKTWKFWYKGESKKVNN